MEGKERNERSGMAVFWCCIEALLHKKVDNQLSDHDVSRGIPEVENVVSPKKNEFVLSKS